MADLHAYVSCGALALEEMLGRLKFRKRRIGIGLRVETYVHLGDLREGVDTGLDCGDFILECEVCVCSARGAVESGHEDGFRGEGGVGQDAVGALDKPGPQSAREKGRLHGVRIGGLLRVESRILLFGIGLDQYCEKFSLLAPDNRFHGSAGRGGDEDVRVVLV